MINDLFGDQIIQIECDFTGETISAQDSVFYEDMGVKINEFMDDHVSLYNEDYAGIYFEYVIKAIVYTDGTTVNK